MQERHNQAFSRQRIAGKAKKLSQKNDKCSIEKPNQQNQTLLNSDTPAKNLSILRIKLACSPGSGYKIKTFFMNIVKGSN